MRKDVKLLEEQLARLPVQATSPIPTRASEPPLASNTKVVRLRTEISSSNMCVSTPLKLTHKTRSKRLAGWVLAGALLLAACTPGADLKPLPVDQSTTYRLGTGDQVRVITFGGDQLTGEFRINDSGNIAIPLLGSVHAAGLTTSQLGDAVATDLQKKDLLKNPSVSVEVLAYRPFFILGEVSKPGEYPYEPGMTVLTAVSIAGGFTYRAVQDYASIVRTTADGAIEGRVTRQTIVRPGDVITVFERRF